MGISFFPFALCLRRQAWPDWSAHIESRSQPPAFKNLGRGVF